MTVEAEEKWYYCGAGVTIGPMSFDDLRAKAASTSLQPPMELVRSTRMDEWKEVSDIPGLSVEDSFSLPSSPGEVMQGDWFYVAGSEQHGPVTLRVLEEMVENPHQSKPLRMVWTVGMKQWTPVNEVEALNDSREKVRQREQAEKDEKRQAARDRAAAELERQQEVKQANAVDLREAARKAIELEEAKSMAEREERLRAASEARARAKALRERKLSPPPTASPPAVSALPDEGTITRKAQENVAAEARLKAEASQTIAHKEKKPSLVNTIRHFLRKKPAELQDLSVMADKAKEEEAAKRANEERRWKEELEQLNKAKQERLLMQEGKAKPQAGEQQQLQEEQARRQAAEDHRREQEAALLKAQQEEKRLKLEAEANRQAEEEKRRQEEEVRRKTEQEKLRREEEARIKAENEAKEAKEARQRAEEQAKTLAEANARAEREAKAAAEAKAKVEEQLRMAEEAKRRAEQAVKAAEESRRRAEESAMARAQEAERLKASAVEGDAKQSNEQQVEKAEKAKMQAEVELKEAEKAKAEADQKATVQAVEEQRLRDEAKEKELEDVRAKQEVQNKSKQKEQAAVQIEILKRAEEQRKLFAEARAAQLEKMAEAQKEIDKKMGVKPKAEVPSNKNSISAIQEARKIAMITSRPPSPGSIQASPKPGSGGNKAPTPKPGESATAGNKLVVSKPGETGEEASKETESKPTEDNVDGSDAKDVKLVTEKPKDPKAVWYYTSGGDKCGPVTFEELRQMADNGSLSPRMDMVWKSDGGSWEKAGDAKGLFQRDKGAANQTAKKEAKAAKPGKNKKKLPSTDSLLQYGVKRRVYVPVALLFPLMWPWVMQQGLAMAGGVLSPAIRQMFDDYGAYVPVVFLFVFSMLRLANVGMNRVWALGLLVPVLNLWVGFRCFACPGHYQTYKKLDGAGVAMAVIYWALVVPTVGALIALAVVMSGYVGDPEMQEQWRQLWESLPIAK